MDFLSILPNDHSATYIDYKGKKCDSPSGVLRYLLYQLPDSRRDSDDDKPQWYPTSLRHRLLYFCVKEFNLGYVRDMCKDYLCKITGVAQSCGSDVAKTSHEIPPKRRKYTEREAKDTPQMLGPMTDNHSLSRPPFDDFSHSLILRGRVSMRSRSPEGGVILMNDYNSDTGHFMPLSFAHVCFQFTFDRLTFTCSCDSFTYYQKYQEPENHQVPTDVNETCMHCRFAYTHLYDFCRDSGTTPKSDENGAIFNKLVDTSDELNCGVVVLSSGDSKSAVKMSVMSKEGECAFIHLSSCRKYVNCENGACKAAMKNKKKACSIDEYSKICGHLQVLHSNQEVWKHFVEMSEDHGDENDEVANVRK